MENSNVPSHLLDHTYNKVIRVSARLTQAAKRPAACRDCSCCSDNQHSEAPANPPQKRRRTSVAQPSTPPADTPASSNLVLKPRAPISPADLPLVSPVPSSPQPTAPPLPDEPLMICGLPVEEYQQLYHEVVDDMLRFKNGRQRPYTLALGRRIKQKLWERLDRPTFTETVDADGRVHVDTSYGVGVHPPQYDVDTSEEPGPSKRPIKRAKH
ncbi:uncharacterized protein LOC131991369 [Centropristis striata]|uniref:uncharacterized protein LOC131991369 n=1 Tax=Centropristis striata TaxID=184440 RepID=UPI0027E1D1B2|nr:uncharacterized protein LOC131991369 [Centropristis striata]